MFYLNQIGIHVNQLMLWPQNWHSTGYITMYIHCTILQLHLVYLKDTWRRNMLISSKSNSVISWKQVINCLTYFSMIKITEENLNWNIHYMSDIEFQFYEDQKGRRIRKYVVFHSVERCIHCNIAMGIHCNISSAVPVLWPQHQLIVMYPNLV